ncbi:MAG: hypothetical protein U7127_04930 [Phormidium sp.]
MPSNKTKPVSNQPRGSVKAKPVSNQPGESVKTQTNQTKPVSNQPGGLVKAELRSDEAPTIVFMFNPTELIFDVAVETANSSGARAENTGQPKVSFSHREPYEITINNILFDTYEDGKDVVKEYIDKFRKSVEFVKGKERVPIYKFIWGSRVHFRCCFIKKLSYKLTMFLSDGTPVRAVINSLTLKEADEPQPNASVNAKNPTSKQRQGDNMNRKTAGKKSPQASKSTKTSSTSKGKTSSRASKR